jgi:uncharacterized membrane protein
MSLTGKLGYLIAGVGAAHFVAPDAFTEATKVAFPKDTDKWVLRDGASELAIGVAMIVPLTRKLGVLSLLGYTGWLGYNVANAQG